MTGPRNPLDRELWKLEQTLDANLHHAFRRLKVAITAARGFPGFDEQVVIEELKRIEGRAYLTSEDIDHLAKRLTPQA